MRTGLVSILLALTAAMGCSSTDVCFSPDGVCEEVLLEEFGLAQESIHAAVYCFTREPLAAALAEAQMRGVDVKVALDPCADFDTAVQIRNYLDDQGVPMRLSENPNDGIMHDKFAVIDGDVVLTGSYNWTMSANEKNDENLVRLANPELAAQFEDEFERLWARGD